MAKEFFCDVETTGFDPKVNSIIELSYIMKIGGEESERGTHFVKPQRDEKISQKVCEFHNLTPTQMNERGSEQSIVKQKVVDVLRRYVNPWDAKDKFFFYAFNSPFDNQFIRDFWDRSGDKSQGYFGSYFWAPDICIMRLAAEKLKNVRSEMENFQQATVAKQLGIEIDESRLHEAEYDLELMMDIYSKVKG